MSCNNVSEWFLMQNDKQNKFDKDDVISHDDLILCCNSRSVHSDSMDQDDEDSGTPNAETNESTENRDEIGRHHQIYIANLTWWTSDQDIVDALFNIGVTDIIKVNFYDSPTNGKSKGSCSVSLGSEESMRICLDRLREQVLHGKNPVAIPLQSYTMEVEV